MSSEGHLLFLHPGRLLIIHTAWHRELSRGRRCLLALASSLWHECSMCELRADSEHSLIKKHLNWPSSGSVPTALRDQPISVQRSCLELCKVCLHFVLFTVFFYLYLSPSLSITLLLPLAFWHFAKAETSVSLASIGCQWHHRSLSSEKYWRTFFH